MSRPIRIFALVLALLAAGPGCFVVDELDNGMKMMDENSPRKKHGPAAEEAAPETAVARREGPSAQEALAKWWKHARTPSSGPRDPATATEIVTCRIGGATRFMSKTDCEVQGGTF
ncbi:MAG TPA: hypothetical protein VKB65_01815 [Myxococcota bacterium]|nr:hypothetical protein [Myxococcota bacterium]